MSSDVKLPKWRVVCVYNYAILESGMCGKLCQVRECYVCQVITSDAVVCVSSDVTLPSDGIGCVSSDAKLGSDMCIKVCQVRKWYVCQVMSS